MAVTHLRCSSSFTHCPDTPFRVPGRRKCAGEPRVSAVISWIEHGRHEPDVYRPTHRLHRGEQCPGHHFRAEVRPSPINTQALTQAHPHLQHSTLPHASRSLAVLSMSVLARYRRQWEATGTSLLMATASPTMAAARLVGCCCRCWRYCSSCCCCCCGEVSSGAGTSLLILFPPLFPFESHGSA